MLITVKQVLKLIWPYLLASAVVIVIIWCIYSDGYKNGFAEAKRQGDKALLDQQIALQQECAEQKQLTARIEDKNAKDTANIDSEFDNYLMHDREGSACVTVASETEPAKTSNKELPKGNGLPVARLDLRLQAKKADKVLVDYNSCLDTLDQIWSIKGQ